MSNFPMIHASLYGVPWAILPAKLTEIAGLFETRVKNGHGNLDYTAANPSPPRGMESYQRVGDKAVISAFGVLSQRSSIMTSGGTAAESIGRAMDEAAKDRSIETIVLNADSPGGSVFGIQEAAARIRAARAVKPVIGVANSSAASAMYWLISQCTEIVVTPGGQLGSIGVVAMHVDESGAEERAGIKTTFVTPASTRPKATSRSRMTRTDTCRAKCTASTTRSSRTWPAAEACRRARWRAASAKAA